MDLIVFNSKILKRDGTPQPIRYEHAKYHFEGDWLVIEYTGAGKQLVAKLQRDHCVQLVEEPK